VHRTDESEVNSDKMQKLEKTMAELEDRWGFSAVRRLGQVLRSSVPHVPTGFPALDNALAIGGLPSGRITEIVGSPTSGVVTLALTLAARAQELSGSAIYVDLGHNFDPQFATHCGLDLNNLVLVRPKDAFQALSILHDFVAGGAIGAIGPDYLPTEPVYVPSTFLNIARRGGTRRKSPCSERLSQRLDHSSPFSGTFTSAAGKVALQGWGYIRVQSSARAAGTGAPIYGGSS
jgi:hypothetical protein